MRRVFFYFQFWPASSNNLFASSSVSLNRRIVYDPSGAFSSLENTEFSSDIESFLSHELGEQFLIKECDSIEKNVFSVEKNNQ